MKFKNSDATAEQNAPLSLGNEELFEGDEIQISFVQRAGYKKVVGANIVKNMGKVVLDGSEDENYTKSAYSDTDFCTFINNDYNNLIKNANNVPLKCNYFINNNIGTSIPNKTGISYIDINYGIRFAIEYSNASDVSGFKTWLSTHNTEVVYPLKNPVITPITDPTLLAQLETIINLKTYKQTTNIESTGADLAPVLDCDYYQDISTLRTELATINARLDVLEQ